MHWCILLKIRCNHILRTSASIFHFSFKCCCSEAQSQQFSHRKLPQDECIWAAHQMYTMRVMIILNLTKGASKVIYLTCHLCAWPNLSKMLPTTVGTKTQRQSDVYRQHKTQSLSHLTWIFFTQSPSLAPPIPPFLARSACKSTLRFGSHTLELTAAESRPKAIWGQGSERDRGRDGARQGGRDRRVRRNDRKQLTGDTKKDMILYHLHL